MDLSTTTNAIEGAALKLAMPAAFVFEITKNDVARAVANNAWGGWPLGVQISYVVSSVIYRTTGQALAYNPYYGADAFVGVAPALNVANAFNGLTVVGALGWAAGGLGIVGPKIEKLGKGVAIGAFFGGLLDPPAPNSQASVRYGPAAMISASNGQEVLP